MGTHTLNTQINTSYRVRRPDSTYETSLWVIGPPEEMADERMRLDLIEGKYASVVKVTERVTWRGANGRRHREVLSETPITAEGVPA